MATRGRDHRAYRKRRDRLRRNTPPTCWLCGNEIDLDLDPRDPMSWTADHVDPLAAGGHLLGELRPAHRACNSRRGDGTHTAAPVGPPVGPTSRNW